MDFGCITYQPHEDSWNRFTDVIKYVAVECLEIESYYVVNEQNTDGTHKHCHIAFRRHEQGVSHDTFRRRMIAEIGDLPVSSDGKIHCLDVSWGNPKKKKKHLDSYARIIAYTMKNTWKDKSIPSQYQWTAYTDYPNQKGYYISHKVPQDILEEATRISLAYGTDNADTSVPERTITLHDFVNKGCVIVDFIAEENAEANQHRTETSFNNVFWEEWDTNHGQIVLSGQLKGIMEQLYRRYENKLEQFKKNNAQNV